MVPGAFVYGKGMDPMAVSIKHRDLAAAMSGEGGRNHLITLVGGGSPRPVKGGYLRSPARRS